MKIFHAFVQVWHTKGDPMNVSNYDFTVTAASERRAKQILTCEVKTYKYWKHHIILEEIKTDMEYLRHWSSHRLTDFISKKALLQQTKVDEKEQARLQKKYRKQGYWSIDFRELFSKPWTLFSSLVENLSPDTEIVIVDGILYLFGNKHTKTFMESRLIIHKHGLMLKVKEALNKVQKELNELEKL